MLLSLDFFFSSNCDIFWSKYWFICLSFINQFHIDFLCDVPRQNDNMKRYTFYKTYVNRYSYWICAGREFYDSRNFKIYILCQFYNLTFKSLCRRGTVEPLVGGIYSRVIWIQHQFRKIHWYWGDFQSIHFMQFLTLIAKYIKSLEGLLDPQSSQKPQL